jgi:hypothetical protein
VAESRSGSFETAVVSEAENVGRLLVRCAMCEADQALVRSHAAADRVLRTHLAECPAANGAAGSRRYSSSAAPNRTAN